MTGGIFPSPTSRWAFLVIGVAIGLVLGFVLGTLGEPAGSSNSRTPHGTSVPSWLPTVSSCFGGSPCNATSTTTNGSGTSCVVPGFVETAGDFLYVAINYMAGSDLVVSIGDGGVDSFTFVAGVFANQQSVAFYDVPDETGGNVTITVSISQVEFGSCTVGQLSAGTSLGVIGPGQSVPGSFDLSVTNSALHEPSLIMALFGATRPTGSPIVTVTPGGGIPWAMGGVWTGTTFLGDAQELVGIDAESSGMVTFNWQVGNSQTPSISGIALEFYSGT